MVCAEDRIADLALTTATPEPGFVTGGVGTLLDVHVTAGPGAGEHPAGARSEPSRRLLSAGERLLLAGEADGSNPDLALTDEDRGPGGVAG